MKSGRTLVLLLLAVSLFQAATTSTTLTVSATVPSLATITGNTINVTGTANLTGIGSGSFNATVNLSTLTTGTSSNATIPFTITLTGGTITGNLSVPLTLLLGSATSGTGSATITGGTGSYSGASGSFGSLSGSSSGSALSGFTLGFSGNGSITTSGSTGGGGGTPVPLITAVLDAASNTANLAQGSIFIVKGANLCPSGYTSFNVPRPTTSPDGVKITFTPTAGGTGTDALLWYEYNQSGVVQLAGILPSTVAPGNYNVTVTNGTASAPFQSTVQASKFSLFTQDSSGTGLASVQNYISQSQVDLNSFTTGNGKATTISPAHPGQFLLAYGTGMGALVGGDNAAAPAYDFSANGVTVKAIVGGMSIPVSYAGRAGYAGEDQINFALPSNVPTGCAVSLQISVNGNLSNATFISIAPDASSNACVMPGFTTQQLQGLDNGGTFTAGGFSLLQVQETVPTVGTVKINSASGAFTQYTAYQIAGAASTFAAISTSGACTVIHTTTSQNNNAVAVGGGILLDAGTVTLNGPSGSNISNLPFTETANAYTLTLAETGLPVSLPGGNNGQIVAGQYTISGAGGKDVGKFNTSITVGTPITVTGTFPTAVNRSAGLTVNWTGGNPSDIVELVGSSSSSTGNPSSAILDSWEFICTATAGAGTITVPASILQQLPAATVSANGSGGGFLELASSATPVSFTAPLTAGGSINSGYFSSFIGIAGQVSYQ
jgi:uncharacterized protein (TIGR03437 family)